MIIQDDLLIPLANGWVCEKRRDRDVSEGYVTHYWSPEGDHFRSRDEIEKYARDNDVSVDMAAFEAADIGVRNKEKNGAEFFFRQFPIIILNN